MCPLRFAFIPTCAADSHKVRTCLQHNFIETLVPIMLAVVSPTEEYFCASDVFLKITPGDVTHLK